MTEHATSTAVAGNTVSVSLGYVRGPGDYSDRRRHGDTPNVRRRRQSAP